MTGAFNSVKIKLAPWANERDVIDAVSAQLERHGLVASGWHTGSMTMRLTAETLIIANGGMGAGIEKLNWLNGQ